ncbi:hypothetical protein RQP46_010550 [Phenoliferia psychrophenolica]
MQASTSTDPRTHHFLPNVISNSQQIHYVKSTTASIAGATAGLLGLTNLSGFAFYLVASLVVGASFAAGNCKASPTKYFAKATDVFLGGLLDNAFAFVLFWTLFYALVHIYD